MTHYEVTWTFTGEFANEYEACYEAFRQMANIIARPADSARVDVRGAGLAEGSSVELIDALIECDPILASQLLGFRHFLWIRQSYAQNRDTPLDKV